MACAVVVVAPGHPWTGLDGVQVESSAEVIERAVAALVVAVTPLVDACRELAPVGRAGLWNEVADGLGMPLCFQNRTPVSEAMVAVLDRAVHAGAAPWRARPSLRFARSEALGSVHVGQEGGCCLAYTTPIGDGAEPHGYCSTCSFRDPDDCDRRQVAWLEQSR